MIKNKNLIKDVHHFVEIRGVCFDKVDPINIAKHEFYKLCQANKDLELFLNTFFYLQNNAYINDKQVLDHFYKKCSNKVKAHLISFERKDNLSVLVNFLQNIDSN